MHGETVIQALLDDLKPGVSYETAQIVHYGETHEPALLINRDVVFVPVRWDVALSVAFVADQLAQELSVLPGLLLFGFAGEVQVAAVSQFLFELGFQVLWLGREQRKVLNAMVQQKYSDRGSNAA